MSISYLILLFVYPLVDIHICHLFNVSKTCVYGPCVTVLLQHVLSYDCFRGNIVQMFQCQLCLFSKHYQIIRKCRPFMTSLHRVCSIIVFLLLVFPIHWYFYPGKWWIISLRTLVWHVCVPTYFEWFRSFPRKFYFWMILGYDSVRYFSQIFNHNPEQLNRNYNLQTTKATFLDIILI